MLYEQITLQCYMKKQHYYVIWQNNTYMLYDKITLICYMTK